ncbi:hypothetical protein C0993_007619 [Termitomyces sp. T159_Od127]|nr:hypothetical protein C0993_007619 [Termitomyces sp. T159_Od127]
MSQSSDSELYERDSQSQFVSQEGDEDVLWEVIEITAEKHKFYKVRWAGFDPKTNKPWAQSWNTFAGSKGSRLSRASLLSDVSRVSANSSSTVAKPSAQDQNALLPINNGRSNGKRSRSIVLSAEEHDEHDITHTKKKRKIMADDSKITKVDPSTGRKKVHVRESSDETVNESEVTTNRPRNKAKSKVLPMKLQEEESSSGDEGTARIQPASSPSRSPSTVQRNVKPRRSSNTRTSTVTSDQDTAYVKYKSGKLSTPKKKRRHKKCTDDSSSSSDEVEEVVQARKSPPLTTKHNDRLLTTSSPTLQQLQAYHSPSLSDSHDEDQMVQEIAGDDLGDVVRQRGEQLAARARAKRQREFDGTIGAVRKKTLIEVLSENEERKGKQRAREHEAPEQWSKSKKSGSSRASSEDAEHESVVEDDVMRLREEEEESTQDLIMDMLDVPMEDVEQNQVRDVESSGQVTREIESPEFPPNPVIPNQKNGTRARSKSKSSSHSVRSRHRNPSQDELILPPTAPVPTSTPIESQEQDTGPDFVATLALLNEKSQENAQLMKEINVLRAAASAPRPRELELERELEVLRASLEAVQVSLTASEKRAADLARGKESAEKDREFFREHYAKASGFVTSVQEENAELQKEVQIAREQASTGVEAVKATYVARVHALEDDARTYKRLAMFIMEKDIRTNDEIRRKAAEEPELRARCDELGEELRGLRNEFVDLQEEMEDKTMRTEELEQQLGSWKRQATFLNADLCQVKSLHEGVDKVYECSWRVDDDVNALCRQIFTTYEVCSFLCLSQWCLMVLHTGV